MRFLKALVLFLAIVALGIFVYGTLKFPERSFIVVRRVSPPPIEEPVTLLFVGDMMLTRGVGVSIWKNGGGDPRYPFLLVASTTVGVDLVVGNLEGPISARGVNVGSIYSFRHPPERVEGLAFAGFDVVSLANNHIWDYGRAALEDTLLTLRDAGIAPVGAGRNFDEANAPYIADIKGTRIAFLSYTNLYPESLWATENRPGISNPDLQNLKSKILNLKSEVDILVILFHWGDEYQPKSHPREQALAHELIDAGADLIVGHHPHVVQEIENYGGKYIAYSLGNFVFDQNFSEETMRGLILKVKVKNKKIESVEPIAIQISPDFQPAIQTLDVQRSD